MPVRRFSIDAENPDASRVADVVASIRKGERVALPTETVYGLAADPEDAAAVARLAEAKGRSDSIAFTHHVADAAAAMRLIGGSIPKRAGRLASRYWPGPLTLVVADATGAPIGVRVPANGFTSAVLAEFPRGLFLSSVNRHGEPPLLSPDELANSDLVDVLCDGGEAALGVASAVVRVGAGVFEVLREGALDRQELRYAAAAKILFVCSGNTCRSPMAGAIARHELGQRLGTNPDDLFSRGLIVSSAGTFAMPGGPASENAVRAVAELGLDLSSHCSASIDGYELATADRIFGLSASHCAAIVDLVPSAASRTALLDPTGADIADPFGGDLDIYRMARDQIAASIQARIDDLLSLAD